MNSLNQFAVIEAHSKNVSIYDSFNANLVVNLYQDAAPLYLAYVESQKCLISSCADMTLNVWNLEDPSAKKRYTVRNKWPTKNATMSLTWVEAHKLLYAGSDMGGISAYNLTDEHAEVKANFKGHSDIVMNMISMQGLNNIVSASLDTTVRIWDTYTEQETNKLVGHNKGVFSLSYNPEHRFIVSAGFDHDAYIWSPFVNTLLFKLKGHTSSLVGCQCVENSNELVTADSNGMFKIWDLRNFMCCQTFTSEHDNDGDLNDLTGLSSFAHVKLPAGGGKEYLNPEDNEEDYRVICGTKRLFFFDQFRAKTEPVTDPLPITVALFNSVSLTIMTVAGKGVKIWDAVMGNLKVEYSNLADWDISCACLDDRQRKFILGDVNGNMNVYNYSNGALMKRFPPFEDGGTVANLVYCGHAKCVIAASINGQIRIYDELDPENCIILREFDHNYIHKEGLNMIEYFHSSAMVMAAGAQGSDAIKTFDFETGKCLSEFKIKDDENLNPFHDDISETGESQEGESSIASEVRNASVTMSQGTSAYPLTLHWPCLRSSSQSIASNYQSNVNSMLNGGSSSLADATNDEPVVYAMVSLDYYPLVAMATSDGKISVFGTRQAHPRIKQACVLKFPNTPPSNATYKGENEQEYPLLHIPRASDDDYVVHEVGHRLSLRRRSVSILDEEGDPTWVTKPRFNSPRAMLALPAHSLVWDEVEEALYSGDESGRIRKWSLKPFLAELAKSGLANKLTKVERTAGVEKYGQRRVRASQGRKTFESSDFQNYLPLPEYTRDDIDFIWGVEGHEDNVSISLVTDSDGSTSLLSWSSDRTVKMWTTEGRPMGLLLGGLEPGTKNPAWDFHMDAQKKTTTDDRDATTVYEQVQKDEEENKNLFGGQEHHGRRLGLGVSDMPPTPSPKKGRKPTKAQQVVTNYNKQMQEQSQSQKETQSQVGGVNVRTIQKLREEKHGKGNYLKAELKGFKETLPRDEEDLRHVRALSVLSDMQTMSAQSYDNDGAAMGSATDADLEDLERNLAKAGRNNNIKVPKGFTMDNMEAFEELGFTLSGPGAISKKKNIARRGEDGNDSGGSPGSEGMGSTRSTTMNLLQTYRKYKPPPTIVPPSPGRRDIITDDVRNSHSRMQRALESWEERSADRMIGDNPFGGKMGVLGVEDFQSPEGLVIEVAGEIEGQVEEEGGAEEVGVEADGEQ
jgi:WD40 repeat protein